MEVIGVFGVMVIWLIGIVWLVLNIILFFKLWSMTNDVREIKSLLKSTLQSKSQL